MGALITFLTAGLARLLGASALKFVAYKVMIGGAVTILLPIVLYNLITRTISELLEFALDSAGAEMGSGVVVQLTGMAAWIANLIDLPLAMSMFLGAMSARFTIRMIRGA